MSIFQSTVTANANRLRIRFIACLVILFGVAVQAQQQLEAVHREALFQRAFNSIGFILYAKRNDRSAIANLTPEELRMMDGIIGTSLQAAFYNWLLEKKAPQFGSFSQPQFSYVISENQIMSIKLAEAKPARLQFSSDQSLFTLEPGQAVRTGMTNPTLDSDIFINLLKINSPQAEIDFASSLSLMIHEFGHKLAAQKNQSAVDSLAAKMEQLIRSQTNTVVLNGKKISTLIINSFPTSQWLSTTLMMQFGQPPKHPLLSIDQQGLYGWIEDDKKIADVTDSLIQAFGQTKDVQISKNKNYEYLTQTLVSPSQVLVSSDMNGHIQFKVSGKLTKFTVPFLKYKLSDPAKDNLYGSSFLQKTNAFEKRQQQEITIDNSSYRVAHVATVPITDQLVGVDIQFMDKIENGKNLELYFSIKGDLSLAYPANNELWPELKILVDDHPLIIKAVSVAPDKSTFKFVLTDFDKLIHKNVQVQKVQMRTKTFVLPVADYDMIFNGFISAEIPLNKQLPSAKGSTEKAVLKSIQLWNGQQWVPFRNKDEAISSTHLRFVFKSNERIRQMTLNQKFQSRIQLHRKSFFQSFPNVQPDYETFEPEQRQMTFDETSMRQTRLGQFLYVDVDVDYKAQTDYILEIPWIYHGAVPGHEPPPEADLQIHKTEPSRLLHGYVQFLTESGQAGQLHLKNDVPFTKIGTGLTEPEISPRILDKNDNNKICRRLFN